MVETLFRTVLSLRNSRPAISAFDRPAATSSRISVSRAESLGKRRCDGATLRTSEIAVHATGDRSRKDGAASGDDANGLDDLRAGRALEDVAGGARPHGGVEAAVVVAHGEHEHRTGEAVTQDAAGGLDAVDAGHLQIHQHDIGMERCGRGDHLVSVGCLADEVEPAGVGDETAQTIAEERMVIGDEDPDTHQISAHSAETSVPRGRSGRMSRVPPSSAARSRMDPMPIPGV